MSGVDHADVMSTAVYTLNKILPVSGSAGPIGDLINLSEESSESLDFDTRYYPYYGMLSNEEKSLYKQVYKAAMDYTEQITPCVKMNHDGAENVINAVIFDHPEIFWIGTGYKFGYTESGEIVQICFKYAFNEDELDAAKLQVEMAANDIINGAADYSDVVDKEIYVHDRIIEGASYNSSDINGGQSLYSALVKGETVCAGYTRAFQYIMTRLGIPTYYCVGYSDGDHAWNVIEINGKFYNVDLTWDDTGNTYYYFNCSDNDIAETHERLGYSVYLPVCND